MHWIKNIGFLPVLKIENHIDECAAKVTHADNGQTKFEGKSLTKVAIG
jgi:hypothetical protein